LSAQEEGTPRYEVGLNYSWLHVNSANQDRQHQPLTKHIALKPIQVEYVMTQIDSTKGFGSHQNDVRYSGGVVFRFGGR